LEPNQPLLWGNKRYHALNYHLRQKFGQKVYKIPLDAGFSCPNRDGAKGYGGCAFCSVRGSGDFAPAADLDIQLQFAQSRAMMQKKWAEGKYIAYFQAFTNTYAPVERLRYLYETALGQAGVVGIAIATRPDCLPPEVLELLAEINQRTYLWVELGLQTIHEKSAARMNLNYRLDTFLDACDALRERQIETCAHVILGLPGETHGEMLETGRVVAGLPLQGLKLHLLHVMRDTPLGKTYTEAPFPLLSREEYVGLVVDILEIISPEVIIHRLTGDSPRDLLIGPWWSLNKWEVLNSIDKEMERRNTWQGRGYAAAKK